MTTAPAGWYSAFEMVKTPRNAKEATEDRADSRSAESPQARRLTAIVDADAPAKRLGMPVPKMGYMHWPQVPEGNVDSTANVHSWDR